MREYTIPVKSIRHLLEEELKRTHNAFYKYGSVVIYSDMQKEMLHIAKCALEEKLKACTTYEQLEDYVTYAGYRMSLQDWIDSL